MVKWFVAFAAVLVVFSCGKPDGSLAEKYMRAQVEYDAGRLEEARRILRSIYNSDPDYANVAVMLGRVAYYQGKYTESIQYLETRLDSESRSINAMLWLMKAQHKAGKNTEAAEIASELVRLDSGNVHAWYVKGMIHESLDELDLAIASYKRAVDESRVLAQAHFRLAKIYRAAGGEAQADYYSAEAKHVMNQKRPL